MNNYFKNIEDFPEDEIDLKEIKYKYSDYMDAIKHTKIRLKVDKGYSPYLISKGLFKSKGFENYIEVLNIINSVPPLNPMSKLESHLNSIEIDLHQYQMHFDFLLHTIPQITKKIKKSC